MQIALSLSSSLSTCTSKSLFLLQCIRTSSTGWSFSIYITWTRSSLAFEEYLSLSIRALTVTSKEASCSERYRLGWLPGWPESTSDHAIHLVTFFSWIARKHHTVTCFSIEIEYRVIGQCCISFKKLTFVLQIIGYFMWNLRQCIRPSGITKL